MTKLSDAIQNTSHSLIELVSQGIKIGGKSTKKEKKIVFDKLIEECKEIIEEVRKVENREISPKNLQDRLETLVLIGQHECLDLIGDSGDVSSKITNYISKHYSKTYTKETVDFINCFVDYFDGRKKIRITIPKKTDFPRYLGYHFGDITYPYTQVCFVLFSMRDKKSYRLLEDAFMSHVIQKHFNY